MRNYPNRTPDFLGGRDEVVIPLSALTSKAYPFGEVRRFLSLHLGPDDKEGPCAIFTEMPPANYEQRIHCHSSTDETTVAISLTRARWHCDFGVSEELIGERQALVFPKGCVHTLASNSEPSFNVTFKFPATQNDAVFFNTWEKVRGFSGGAPGVVDLRQEFLEQEVDGYKLVHGFAPAIFRGLDFSMIYNHKGELNVNRVVINAGEILIVRGRREFNLQSSGGLSYFATVG